MKPVAVKWVTAAVLAIIASTSMAQDRKSSWLDCGLRFGTGGGNDSKGSEYQPHKFRSDFQDVRPLPLQVETEQEDFSLAVKSDSGERRLMEVITVARFECALD